MTDQDNICNSVAHAHYWTMVDITDVYKQIHIEPADIWKIAFTMIYSTYTNNTILIEDYNAPSTFQWFMINIFCDHIRIFLHVYLDVLNMSLMHWQGSTDL
jgi:hypothetical protein